MLWFMEADYIARGTYSKGLLFRRNDFLTWNFVPVARIRNDSDCREQKFLKLFPKTSLSSQKTRMNERLLPFPKIQNGVN